MQYVALALLILIPLVLLIAGTALRRTPMLMVGGIAGFGVAIYCFAETASTAGEYSDIYAIMGAVCFMLAAYGFTGRLWIGEEEAKVLEKEEEKIDSESFDNRMQAFRDRLGLKKKEKKPPEF